MGVNVIQVQPFRLRIDLEEATQLARGRYHAVHVDLVWFALADQPAGRMPDDGNVAVLHGPHHPLGLGLARQIEERMHRGHDHVEFRKRRIRQIEAAVLENIDLDALEDREVLELGIELVDRANLPRHPRRIEAVRHATRRL